MNNGPSICPKGQGKISRTLKQYVAAAQTTHYRIGRRWFINSDKLIKGLRMAI